MCASSMKVCSRRCGSRIAICRTASCPTKPSVCSIPPARAWRWARIPLPPAIEDATRTLDDLAVQTRILERESASGADHAERLVDIAAQTTIAKAHLEALNERWERERNS